MSCSSLKNGQHVTKTALNFMFFPLRLGCKVGGQCGPDGKAERRTTCPKQLGDSQNRGTPI